MLGNALIITVIREKIKVKLALAISTGARTILADEIMQTPLLAVLKTIKACLCNQKWSHIYLIFYCMTSFDYVLMKIIFNFADFI